MIMPLAHHQATLDRIFDEMRSATEELRSMIERVELLRYDVERRMRQCQQAKALGIEAFDAECFPVGGGDPLMTRATIHDRLVASLRALGAFDVTVWTMRYTVLRLDRQLKRVAGSPHQLEMALMTEPRYWFVGHAGALRYHGTPTATKSFAANDTTRTWLLERAVSDHPNPDPRRPS